MLTMLSLVLALSAGSHRGECKTAYGKTVCGYHCAAAYGKVECARTPMGACHAAYGELVCWDPPRSARYSRGERAECIAAYGVIRCGFDCTAAYGEVRCAQTPAGACRAAYGELVCWDPPPSARYSRERAECLAAYGIIRCGFGCVAEYGEVKCARAPGGFCRAEDGALRCFEPEPHEQDRTY